eukprot:CAMPEP_0172516556 /NCGR_PEP_ID=MMETSP1066-20121228/277125_1 /TAXON_ID=671091 /ORGANISM="Coscinodiscus wailesii, Strain CCMP2513" /LENGTH=98 /DNA_ID=CAMNT_0013298091 /DNA_START=471 /DNA_END=767 /DNA_ORIENTATION=-
MRSRRGDHDGLALEFQIARGPFVTVRLAVPNLVWHGHGKIVLNELIVPGESDAEDVFVGTGEHAGPIVRFVVRARSERRGVVGVEKEFPEGLGHIERQ